jgi:uncharacterized protein YoxC
MRIFVWMALLIYLLVLYVKLDSVQSKVDSIDSTVDGINGTVDEINVLWVKFKPTCQDKDGGCTQRRRGL